MKIFKPLRLLLTLLCLSIAVLLAATNPWVQNKDLLYILLAVLIADVCVYASKS